VRRLGSVVIYSLLLIATFTLASLHAEVAIKPAEFVGKTAPITARFIDKSQLGIHQMILTGTPFERGYNLGKLTSGLLLRQEAVLFDQLEAWIPNRIALKGFAIFCANWFRGLQNYFEPWALEEMYGVSLSAPQKYDFVADGFTRQIAYHGLHEVGQLMVDKGVGFGCTLAAVPYQGAWIIGRNFDFEGGDIFDREKIMKWVFPDRGNSYVSVIWAGMVGVVTGVNENGLYISLNAAGSDDFSRVGTPSTLVIAKALQFSHSIDDAIEVFKTTPMFITDIFILSDTKSGRTVRIEKSPERTVVEELTRPTIVANHLVSPEFANDQTNEFRKREQTTIARYERGMHLLDTLHPENSRNEKEAISKILSIMRDKGEADGKPLHLNNRSAIDSLIAAHAAIFDGARMHLFVSQGPALAGAFTGFDLKESFRKREPVTIEGLPADSALTESDYVRIRHSERTLWQAQKRLSKHDCEGARTLIDDAGKAFDGSSLYHQVLGSRLDECDHDSAGAHKEWQKALDLHPAYKTDRDSLTERLTR
jgi:isopenicillin-N N-acyltransferase-like protein